MSKILIRNGRLLGIWSALVFFFVSFAVAINLRQLPFTYLRLAGAYLLFALGCIFLYKWTIANHIQYKNHQLTLRDWKRGLFYTGIWDETIDCQIPVADIKEIWFGDLNEIKAYAQKTKDTQLETQLRIPPNLASLLNGHHSILNIVYKDGRIHLSHAGFFSLHALNRLFKYLKAQGIPIRRFFGSPHSGFEAR